MIKLRDPADFATLVAALAQDVVDAHIHFRLREDLITALHAKPDVGVQSPNFWNLTLQAHQTTALHALFRAYDKERAALHFHSWLVTIQANLHLFSTESFRERLMGNPHIDALVAAHRPPDPQRLAADIASCSPSDPVVKRLAIFRNSYSAHRAVMPVLGKAPSKANDLTYEDVRTLLTRAKDLLNDYSSYFSPNVYSVNLVGRDDFQYIFDSVDAAVQRTKAEWQDLVATAAAAERQNPA